MATSGSVNYTQNTNQIIQGGLRHLGMYSVGRTVSNEIMALAQECLNDLVLELSLSPHLWTESEGYLFPTIQTAEFSIGPDSTDANAVDKSDAVITRVDGAHSAADTTILVESATGMAISDKIGIVLTNKNIQWTTISNISSNTITIASGLTSAASDHGMVYTYTNKINKPMSIDHVRRLHGFDSGSTSTLQETALGVRSRFEYLDMSNKTQNGTPTSYYTKKARDNMKIFLWPRPSDASYYYTFNYFKRIEDFDNGTDSPDFPAEWIPFLKIALAIRMAPSVGKDQKMESLILLASQYLQKLEGFDSETVHMIIGLAE
jgi:hypothetical protein